MKADTVISIVIPYYNDREAVGRCLDSISAAIAKISSEYKTPDIYLVDDNSPEPFDSSMSPVEINVYRFSENSGAGAARNMGASMCNDSHILFIDSDVMLEENHLDRLYRLIESNDACIFQGPTSIEPANLKPSLFQRYMAASWNYYEYENWNISVFTQCFCIEKSFFENVGKFTEKYKKSGGEEFELGLRLNALKPGFILFDEKLVHFHHFDNIVKRMKKVFLRSRYISSIALKMPDLPFRFTALVLMRSAYAWVLNGFVILAFFLPLHGFTGWLAASFLFYISDSKFSLAMKKAQSGKLSFISIVFRQIEYSFVNLGMVAGVFFRYFKDKP